jgi:hypothetical protein
VIGHKVPEDRSVNCYFCGGFFDERHMINADPYNESDGGEVCSGCLQAMIADKWETLGNIPIGTDERTEEAFERFPSGTNREEIWQWFESHFDVRVHDLMFPNRSKDDDIRRR